MRRADPTAPHAIAVAGGRAATRTAVMVAALVTVAFRPLAFALPFAALLSFPALSHALDQSKHRAVTRDACAEADLPWDFCERVGIEAYNVDHFEWHDMAAHAQVDVDAGQTQCDGANAAAQRVAMLGVELSGNITAFSKQQLGISSQTLATSLGRALHTIQDNCAHRGVSNPHHAWLSHDDTCLGTSSSPDARPEALTCAQTETAAVIETFVAALEAAGVQPHWLDDQGEMPREITRFPARGDVCEFLGSGGQWNGIDDHWNDAIVVPALRQSFGGGLGSMASASDVCHGDPLALAVTPDPAIDTSKGQAQCGKVSAYCFGKDDSPDDLPPWQDPAQADGDNAGSPPEQGCSVAAEPGPAPLGWLLLLPLVLRRRR